MSHTFCVRLDDGGSFTTGERFSVRSDAFGVNGEWVLDAAFEQPCEEDLPTRCTARLVCVADRDAFVVRVPRASWNSKAPVAPDGPSASTVVRVAAGGTACEWTTTVHAREGSSELSVRVEFECSAVPERAVSSGVDAVDDVDDVGERLQQFVFSATSEAPAQASRRVRRAMRPPPRTHPMPDACVLFAGWDACVDATRGAFRIVCELLGNDAALVPFDAWSPSSAFYPHADPSDFFEQWGEAVARAGVKGVRVAPRGLRRGDALIRMNHIFMVREAITVSIVQGTWTISDVLAIKSGLAEVMNARLKAAAPGKDVRCGVRLIIEC